jgi:hypothetical protein
MKMIIIIVSMTACGNAPVDALCADVNTDNEIISCALTTLNKQAGCQLVTADGTMITTQRGKVAIVSFVASIDAPLPAYDKAPGAQLVGLTTAGKNGNLNIEVAKQEYDRYFEVSVLTHELGHVIGLYYPDDKGDEIHSTNPNDIMFHNAANWLNDDNVKAFVAQLNEQNLGCSY